VTAAPDVLGDDVRPPSRRRRAALVLAAAVLLAGVGVERYESDRRFAELLAAATAAEQVVTEARTSLGGLVRYSNGLLGRTDLRPTQRVAILDVFALDAGRFLPRMQERRAALAAVDPLPWDRDLHAARDAYLARVDAWLRQIESAQRDPDLLLRERRDTRTTRAAAAEALEEAAGRRSSEEVAALTTALMSR
jgi:hypothetical protein